MRRMMNPDIVRRVTLYHERSEPRIRRDPFGEGASFETPKKAVETPTDGLEMATLTDAEPPKDVAPTTRGNSLLDVIKSRPADPEIVKQDSMSPLASQSTRGEVQYQEMLNTCGIRSMEDPIEMVARQ